MSTEEADDDARTAFPFGEMAFALQHAMDLRGDSNDDSVESEDDDDDNNDDGVPDLVRQGERTTRPTMYRVQDADEEEDEEGKEGGEDDDFDDDETIADAKIYTADGLLLLGLQLVGYTKRRIGRAKTATNIERFKFHFGSTPTVCLLIWEDLHTTENPKAFFPPKKRNINHLLMALHHLKGYPTEIEREAMFDISPQYYARDWVWYFVEKIQALKAEKIYLLDDEFGDDIWIMTVDGTHCWIHEPKHPTWSQDSKYYSHKYAKAGINYELGISLTENRLLWMNGPFPAGCDNLCEKGPEGVTETTWKERTWGRWIWRPRGSSEHPKCSRFKGGQQVQESLSKAP
jgi:hypothetical protein